MLQIQKHIPVPMLCILLMACGTDSGSGDQSTMPMPAAATPTPVTLTQSGSLANPTTISIRLTDAPIDDLVRAVVQFTAVELKRQSGGWVRYTLNQPKTIDLMQLQGANTADLMINVPADAGDYKEIRLFTASAAAAHFVELSSGGTPPLDIPGGHGAGLKLKQNFTITATQAASFVIDFDLRQSIVSPGKSGKYQLKPVMRLIAIAGVGHIRGVVNALDLTAASCSDALVDTFNAIYVYNGHNVTPDDINQSSSANIEPVTTAPITYDVTNSRYIYDAAFLPAGDYTVALTCNADDDILDTDDNLLFFGIRNVSVLANDTVFLK